MSNRKTELKALQAEWYQKLKESGFEDIEDTNSPRELLISWHSTCFKGPSAIESETRIEYFDTAQTLLNTHKFDNPTDRCIWELHASGKSIRQTVAILRDNNTLMHRSSVFRALKRIIKTMKQGSTKADAPGPSHKSSHPTPRTRRRP